MSPQRYKINDYIAFLKSRMGCALDERNLKWKKQGHSLLVIDITHERVFIVYDPAILGHWEFEEGEEAYQRVVKNHFSHILKLKRYPNVIPFKPPRAHKKS